MDGFGAPLSLDQLYRAEPKEAGYVNKQFCRPIIHLSLLSLSQRRCVLARRQTLPPRPAERVLVSPEAP